MKKILCSVLVLFFIPFIALAYLSYPVIEKYPAKLSVPFRVAPYRLIVKEDVKNKYKENRLPRVFAVRKKTEIKILRPQDLLSIIPSLRSTADVVAFVRLFTDGNTHNLFMEPGALEVFIVDANDLDMLNDDNYGWGLISPQRAEALGMKPISVKRTGTKKLPIYVVTRYLVFYPQPGKVLRLCEVTEKINVHKKTYERSELRIISDEPWVERLLSKRAS